MGVIIIPRTCDYVTLCGKKDFVDMIIKFRIWWQGNQHSLCSCVDSLSPSVITRVLLGERQEGQSWRWWYVMFSSVQFSCSVVSDSATPWTAARQASLSITNSQSLLKLISIESVMPSNHLILCRPLLLSHSIFPSIRVFGQSIGVSASSVLQYSGLISFRMNWLDLLAVQGTLKSLSNTTVQKHQF